MHRGLLRHYRVGRLSAGPGSAVVRHHTERFYGRGLRPLSPVHLRHRPDGAGGDHFRWIRRSRIGADDWGTEEVPLGEWAEAYLVRVIQDGQTLIEQSVTQPAWHLSAAERSRLGLSGAFVFAVAQLSDRVGPGGWGRLSVPG